jgi:hypothetical protein
LAFPAPQLPAIVAIQKNGEQMKRVDRPIGEKVWRRGWRHETAATQMASAEVARFIRNLEQDGLADSAEIFRQAAMLHGVQDIEAIVKTALRAWRAKREQSADYGPSAIIPEKMNPSAESRSNRSPTDV